MAQRKRAGLITRRTLDRNQLLLDFFSIFSFFFLNSVLLFCLTKLVLAVNLGIVMLVDAKIVSILKDSTTAGGCLCRYNNS